MENRPLREPTVEGYRQQLHDAYLFLARVCRAQVQPSAAAAATRECRTIFPNNPDVLYGVGVGLSLCIPLVAKGKTNLVAEEQNERVQYADQAMDALQEAIRLGFRDVEDMKRSPDLEPLRARADFQRLLAELIDRTFPADPIALQNEPGKPSPKAAKGEK